MTFSLENSYKYIFAVFLRWSPILYNRLHELTQLWNSQNSIKKHTEFMEISIKPADSLSIWIFYPHLLWLCSSELEFLNQNDLGAVFQRNCKKTTWKLQYYFNTPKYFVTCNKIVYSEVESCSKISKFLNKKCENLGKLLSCVQPS